MNKWMKRNNKGDNEYDIIDKIAKIRGISDVDRFLNPTENEMFDPYRLKNIKEAGKRIVRAINNKDRIVVSIDSDVDGITSGTMMIRYLLNRVDNVEYIYSQRSSGPGIAEQIAVDFVNDDDLNSDGLIINKSKKDRMELNLSNLEKLSNCDLLIIIDSSSNDVDACKKLKDKYGLDIIIIDHHVIEKENDQSILVNPQQDGCEYPNKDLSGAGVAYKVIEVVEDMIDDELDVDYNKYMDLVAVGMFGDVMRVDVLENRYMIMQGLRNMKNVGLVRILKGAKADLYKLNSDSIGFSIAPMINGVTRLDNIELAIEILLTDDDTVAKKLRLKMHKLNEERKEIQKELVEKYSKDINENEKIIIVSNEDSSKGFNGLVAQQLASKYKRPVFVGRNHSGSLSGSFRSYDGFNVKKFLEDSGLVETGGHSMAGGITMKYDDLDKLKEYISENMPELKDVQKSIIYDLEISQDEINDYIKPVERFNLVAGNKFPKIIVRVNNVMLESVETIGKTMETRKFKTLESLEMVKFKVDENYAYELGVFDEIDVVGQLQMNEWYNFGLKKKISNPQIIIDDYKKSDN